MERHNIKTIALGLTFAAGALVGCEKIGDIKKSEHPYSQEIADSLRQDCPQGKKPVLYEVYTISNRPEAIIEEAMIGKRPMDLTGLMVSCKRDSGAPTK
jgi:hypothetical protein